MVARDRYSDPIVLEHPRLIFCEGQHDAAFFRALILHYNLPASNVYSVRDIEKKAKALIPMREGADLFEVALTGIRIIPGFFTVLKDIVLVRDSDHDCEAAFAHMQSQVKKVPLEKGAHKYPVPSAPHLKASGSPSVTILLLPWHDRKGALETLCVEAALAASGGALAECIRQFESCANISDWHDQKKAKLRLRLLLAGLYKKRPDITLGRIWIEAPNLIPISDSSFFPIRDFLANL